ncbi:ABC transporter ATP-binding protein [Primorskyibacter flagellatus]|uniref:ABC transporter ATP-binding protein n=1 Tax=Primorskyibacter flagellatus TaxID=1387277 RepID=A0A917AI35_9RHOB|nr:ABC transporter ATP-binding protein [Primorskyibacter flagellatus]GGE50149.1 ABC transporter ATP-binding protein [Primorskyibacter flagellatus]
MDSQNLTLVVDGLSKLYWTKSRTPGGGIQPISFTLEPGTFFTLLGPSGCGKTTTLRCLAGLEHPDVGRLSLGGTTFFDGEAGDHVPLNKRNIGMVFQSYAIWPHMTVFENVAFPLRVRKELKLSGEEIRQMVTQALTTVGLAGYESRSATQLSGGQQQRVALARAIVRKPGLLLLDEPLSNLDARLRDEMRNELKRLQKQIGITTIYVTHDQVEALEMSDVIAVINAGQVEQMGSPRDVYDRPANAFVANFMGATNFLSARLSADQPADSRGTVALDTGETLDVWFPHAVRRTDRIAVSMRPDVIRLAAAGSDNPEGGNRLTGTVVSSGFMGNIERYSVKVGDEIIQVHQAPDAHFDSGSRVDLLFRPERTLGLLENRAEVVGAAA